MSDILAALPNDLKLEVMKWYSKYKIVKEIVKGDDNNDNEFKKTYLIKNFVGQTLCYADFDYSYKCIDECKFKKDPSKFEHLPECFSNECYNHINYVNQKYGFDVQHVYIKPHSEDDNNYASVICSVSYQNEKKLYFKKMWKIRTHSDDYNTNYTFNHINNIAEYEYDDDDDLGNNNGTIFVNDDGLIDIMKDLDFTIDNIHKIIERYKN